MQHLDILTGIAEFRTTLAKWPSPLRADFGSIHQVLQKRVLESTTLAIQQSYAEWLSLYAMHDRTSSGIKQEQSTKDKSQSTSNQAETKAEHYFPPQLMLLIASQLSSLQKIYSHVSSSNAQDTSLQVYLGRRYQQDRLTGWLSLRELTSGLMVMPLELKLLRLLGEVCLLSQMLLALELEKTLKSIREMNSKESLREQQIQMAKDLYYSGQLNVQVDFPTVGNCVGTP